MPFDKSELEINLVNIHVCKVISLLHVHDGAYYKEFLTKKFQLLVIICSFQ